MAEERTLAVARSREQTAGEPSKEELQRRLEVARDSISNTVTEIKETVAQQVQVVKDTLDWREQFKKRPVAWCAGALGVGFSLGYCIANYAKRDAERDGSHKYAGAAESTDEESRRYSAQRVLTSAAMSPQAGSAAREENGSRESGPGFFQKIASTQTFEKVKDEAGNIGNALVQELSKTAKNVVLPALMASVRNFIGERLPNAEKQQKPTNSAYQPSLERSAN